MKPSIYKTLLLNLGTKRSILERKIFTYFSFTAVFILVIIWLGWYSSNKLKESGQWVAHTYKIQNRLSQLLAFSSDAESSARGYALTGDSLFIKTYAASSDSIHAVLSNLHILTADNPKEVYNMHLLDSLYQKRMNLLNLVIAVTRAGKPVDKFVFFKGKIVMDQITDVIDRANNEEARLMSQRTKDLEDRKTQLQISIIIFSLVLLAILIASLITILTEVRKRIALEELLKAILDASLSGIQSFESIRDLNGNIIDFKYLQANATSQKMIAGVPGSYVGRTLLQVFPATKKEGLFDEFIEVVDNGAPFEKEHYFNYKNLRGWFRMVAVKLRDGFTLTFDDITPAKEAEFTIKNQVKALERSNKELEEFAYVASHDLQEPLRKILAFSDRVRLNGAESFSPDTKNYFSRIINSAERMRTLINDLLTYSKIGSINTAMVPVDLNEVLQETLYDLEVVIQQKGATISFDKLPVIDGIKFQLQQLFLNLINNSLKFSDGSRSPVIEIQCRLNDLQARSCSISFKDNGIGFDPKYADKIFRIFQKLHGRSEYEGTGIGLAICKKIVDNHKGNIKTFSTPDRGTTFVVTLPLKQITIPANE